MNINQKTGKVWVNNYLQMYGTLFSNQKHKYIQLQRYYDIIGRLEGKTKSAYAMILHSHIAQITCNRSPGVHANIFMYIDNKKGTISNSKEMKEWMLSDKWMNCNGSHLLEIASNEVWWVVYKSMLDVGLLTTNAGVLRAMIPIDGRFLPIPYAYVAFLSRIKKDSELKKSIEKSVKNLPKNLEKKLEKDFENFSKTDLIKKIVEIKTEKINSGNNREMYKMLFEEVSEKYPHQWGSSNNNNSKKSRKNLLDKITDNITEKITDKLTINGTETEGEFVEKIVEKIPEKIQEDIDKINARPKPKELPVEDLHNFESNKKQRIKSDKSDAPRNESDKTKITEVIDLPNTLFFADDVTGKDSVKIIEKNSVVNSGKKSVKKSTKKPVIIPENNIEENFNDLTDFDLDAGDDGDDLLIPSTIQESCDIFGLPINNTDLDVDDNVPLMPDMMEIPEPAIKNELNELKEIQNEMDEFWSKE